MLIYNNYVSYKQTNSSCSVFNSKYSLYICSVNKIMKNHLSYILSVVVVVVKPITE